MTPAQDVLKIQLPRRNVGTGISLTLILFLLNPFIALAGPSVVNLLDNGDFEQGQTPWGLNETTDPATAELITDGSEGAVHSGKQAMRVRNDLGTWSHFYQSKWIPAGREYEVSLWVKGGAPFKNANGKMVHPGVLLHVYEYGNLDLTKTTTYLQTLNQLPATRPDEQWHKLTAKIKTTEGIAVRHFSIVVGIKGEVYLDDIVLREADSLSEARIFYLSFDGSFDAADDGGDRIAEVRGNPRLVAGKKRQAASFTDNANLVFDAEGNFDQAEGTVAMWVLPYWPNDDGVPHCFLEIPVRPELFTDGGFVVTKGWSSGIQPNGSYFYNSPGHYHISGGQPFEANEWMHLAFSWSVSTKILKLYVNGELVTIRKYENIGARPPSAGRPLVVGARLGGKSLKNTDKGEYYGHLPRNYQAVGGDGADAALDELMIFNRALTGLEVARLAETQVEPAAPKKPLDSSHVNRVEALLETPHVKFGRPLAAGPVKAFFLCPLERAGSCRDLVELAQRFDVQFTAVTMYFPWTFAYVPYYFRAREGLSPGEKTKETLDRLAEDPEVTVLANVVYSCLPGGVKSQILERVQNGMGLVVTSPRKLPGSYQPVAIAGAREEILKGVPLAALPEFFPGKALSRDERAAGAVSAYEFGKGRVVVIRWTEEEPVDGNGFDGLAPVATDGRWTRQFEHRYNYHLGLVGKALLWAAKREPRARWSHLPADGSTFQPADLPKKDLAIEVTWSGEQKAAILTATICDPLGQIESETRNKTTLVKGPNTISFPLPKLKHGLHFLDLKLTTDAGVENWATVSIRVGGPERIAEMATESEYYERGQTVRGTITFQGTLTEAAKLEVRAKDTNGRVYNHVTVPVAAGKNLSAFKIVVDRPTTLATHIEADLVRDNKVLSFADTVVFVPKRNFKGFLNVLWCTIPNEGIGQVALRKIREAGFNAVYHGAGAAGHFRNDAMADLMPVQYCTRITLRPDARGWSTGFFGNGFLDPKTQEGMRQIVEGTEESRLLGAPYYSLGDENYFQFGIGYSPYEIQAFRKFLERRYGVIDRLNEEYGAQYGSFEEVPRFKESETFEKDLIPALVDHRLGTDDEWARYHEFLAQEIRKVDLTARVGAEGSHGGNLERTLEGVQMWGPYGDDVLLRSLATRDHLNSHWWGGYDNGDEDCTRLWQWLIRDFANYQQFFCAQHVDGAIFNSDFSFRPYFQNLLPELREIYAGPALLLRDAEVVSDDAIAVHWSRESDHASHALKKLGTSQSSRSSLVKTLRSLSRDYRYISSKQIAAGQLQTPRAKILFLPASHALSEEAAEGIVEFVQQGGTAVADFLPSLNEFGRRLQEGRLDELFGATGGGTTKSTTITDLRIDTTIGEQPVQLVCPRTVGHAGVTVKGAKALAPIESLPLMLVNKVGRGRAILLGFDLSRCSRTQREGFVDSLIKVADAESEYRLTAPPETELSILRRGNITLVGVVLPKDENGPIGISWSTSAHTYDVRTKKYLGEISEVAIPAKEKPQRVHLFALQQSPMDRVNIQSPETVKPGDSCTLDVNMRFQDLAMQPVERLVRVDVTDPNDQLIPHYRSFVSLTGATGQATVPFAFNDTAGPWTVTATDVATGTSAEKVIVLGK